MQLLRGMNTNETVDLSQPHLRRLFSSHPWLLVSVVILYTLLILLGILGNLLLLIMLLRSHTYSDIYCIELIRCEMFSEHIN